MEGLDWTGPDWTGLDCTVLYTLAHLCDVHPVDEDAPVKELNESEEDAHEGGLAGARAPNHPHLLHLAHLEMTKVRGQETRHSTVGRSDLPMCCNVIYHVPVPREREYLSLGHSQDL